MYRSVYRLIPLFVFLFVVYRSIEVSGSGFPVLDEEIIGVCPDGVVVTSVGIHDLFGLRTYWLNFSVNNILCGHGQV
jgi:hypothetical protein